MKSIQESRIMKTLLTYNNLPHLLNLSAILFFLGMLFPSSAHAQHEDLLDKTWYLYKVEVEGVTYPYHSLELQSGDESNIEIIIENELDGIIQMYGCPGSGCAYYVDFIEEENKMILVDKICLASYPCYGYDDYIAGYAEITSYFNAFYENFGSTIDYDWQTIDAISYLIFTDEDGDKLYYTEENLSIADFEELGFSIYPNPTQDWLHIHLEELSNNTSLEVYDVQGKL
ncbi:MAG TPA: hypothetical protein VK050_03420, partial [Flavobacteriaceae bacterium]|nr:hypothetical protein [Flavobacteriaceae bacterium]